MDANVSSDDDESADTTRDHIQSSHFSFTIEILEGKGKGLGQVEQVNSARTMSIPSATWLGLFDLCVFVEQG